MFLCIFFFHSGNAYLFFNGVSIALNSHTFRTHIRDVSVINQMNSIRSDPNEIIT